MKITLERAIEILEPTHRECYSDLPDGMEQVNEACRMGMESLKKQKAIKPKHNNHGIYFCPVCGGSLWQIPDESKYCFRCGQSIDWRNLS